MLKRSIVDKLVDPRAASIEEHGTGVLALHYTKAYQSDKSDEVVTISDNALGQMCSVAKIPKTYVTHS
jgi:hypothetical protein